MARLARTSGFTILEVMIAVVILAVGLSSLFASEAGAIRVAQRARTTTVATLLARCKMAEIEEKIAKDGFTTNSIDERDACCDGAEHDGFSCDWKVERLVLPELDATPEEAAKRATEKFKGQQTDDKDKDKTSSSSTPGPDGKIDEKAIAAPSDPAGTLMGTGGGGDMLSSMLLEMSFPIMKPIIEENVRRVTVNVHWKEGSKEQSFDVVQFIVNEALGIVPTMDEEEAGAAQAAQPGAPPQTTQPGAPPQTAQPVTGPGVSR